MALIHKSLIRTITLNIKSLSQKSPNGDHSRVSRIPPYSTWQYPSFNLTKSCGLSDAHGVPTTFLFRIERLNLEQNANMMSNKVTLSNPEQSLHHTHTEIIQRRIFGPGTQILCLAHLDLCRKYYDFEQDWSRYKQDESRIWSFKTSDSSAFDVQWRRGKV